MNGFFSAHGHLGAHIAAGSCLKAVLEHRRQIGHVGEVEMSAASESGTPRLVEAFYHRIWNDGDLDAARAMMSRRG